MTLPSSTPAVELKILDDRLNSWGLPRYQSAQAAAIDLMACLDEELMVPAGTPAVLVPAGFAIHMNDPHMMAVIAPRSGLGHKKGLVLGNGLGVIDADYTGPLMVSVWNRNPLGSEPIRIQPGERIAQLMFVPVLRPLFEVVDEFSDRSERGEGGFGSTGR